MSCYSVPHTNSGALKMPYRYGTAALAKPMSPSSLPPELLGRIFGYHIQSCKELWHQGLPYQRPRPPSCLPEVGPYTWIRVTHVCRYWRNVALTNPLLWSQIVLTRSLDCIQTMIARSQQTPLTVQNYTSCRMGECAMPMHALRLVLLQLHRIRAVELCIKWWVFDDIAPALEKPTPLLESFKLSTPSGLHDTGFVPPVVRFSQVSGVPPLKDLTLCSYGFPWSNPTSFRCLNSLHIQKGSPYCPHVEDVLRALRFMPDLSSLRLDDIFYTSSKATGSLPVLPDVVRLGSLKELTLSGDSISCATLLNSLDLPTNTVMVFGFQMRLCPVHLALSLPVIRAKFTCSDDIGKRPDGELKYGAPVVIFDQDWISYTAHFFYEVSHALEQDKSAPRGNIKTLRVRIPNEPEYLEVLCSELRVGDAKKVCVHGMTTDTQVGIDPTTTALQGCSVKGPFTVTSHADGLLVDCSRSPFP